MPPPPADAEVSAQARRWRHCRWGGTGRRSRHLAIPPKAQIKLQSTGRQVLERCDGVRTFGEIIAELQKEFASADPEKIRGDISQFLEQLQRKRIVDY